MLRRAGSALASQLFRRQSESILRLSAASRSLARLRAGAGYGAGGDVCTPWRAVDRGIAASSVIASRASAFQELSEPETVVVEAFEKVAHQDEALAGKIAAQVERRKNGSQVLYVKSLTVDPAHRRQGFGSSLMKDVLELAAREYNAVEAYLLLPTDDAAAVAFCEKHGFTISERLRNFHYKPGAPDCYVLQKRIQSDPSDTEEPSQSGSSLIAEYEKEARDGDILAGSIVGQVQRKKDGLHLYFKSLTVGPGYQRRGVGTSLMESCLEAASGDHQIVEAHMHVPTNDSRAIAFCEKSGFTITDRIRNYYTRSHKNFQSPDCYVFSKKPQPDGRWLTSENEEEDTDTDEPSETTPATSLENINQELLEPVQVVAEFQKDAGDGTNVAGSVLCQVVKKKDHWLHLYIQSIVISPAYRRQTIGSQLVKHCVDFAQHKFGVVEAYLYVPTSNQAAMAFCERLGFTIKERLRNFYIGSESSDSYVYSKRLVEQTEQARDGSWGNE